METQTLPVPQQDQELVRLQGEASKVLAGAKEIKIVSDETRDYAVAYVSQTTNLLKAIELERVARTAPHEAYQKSVNIFVKSFAGPVKEADDFLRKGILDYRKEQERKAEAERRRQEEERRKAEEEARRKALEAQRKLDEAARLERAAKASADKALQIEADKRLREAMEAEQASQAAQAAAEKPVAAPPPPARMVQTGMGSATVKKHWTYEIVDKSLIPFHYMSVSDVAINHAIHDGVREIPGLRIYQKEGLAIR